jgi:hypothetical protein
MPVARKVWLQTTAPSAWPLEALNQVAPQRGMYPRHSEIEGDYRKLCQQSLDEGLAAVALGRRPCAVKAV